MVKKRRRILSKNIDRIVTKDSVIHLSGLDYREKVISYLSRNLGEKITINSIKKNKGLSYGHLHSTIHDLKNENIIRIEEVGNYKLISLNTKNMLTIAELAKLYVKITLKLFADNKKLAKLNKLIKNLRKHNNILSIVLFGSHARMEADEKSDIDIIVIISEENKLLTNKIKAEIRAFGVKEFLEVQAFVVDSNMFLRMLESKEKLNIGKEALKEGIILEGYENYWKLIGDVIG